MKTLVGAFYQKKALVGAFSVITNLQMELFQALAGTRVIYTSMPRVLCVAGARLHVASVLYVNWCGLGLLLLIEALRDRGREGRAGRGDTLVVVWVNIIISV